MPTIDAPRSLASCNALTRLGLTFFSRLPPPTENTSSPSFSLSRLPLSHSTNTLGPALVVGAGGQFADVVGRRVALDPGDLAEIVDRVRGVGRAAAHAQDEEPPAARAHVGEQFDGAFAEGGVDLGDDFGGFAQVLFGVVVLMGFAGMGWLRRADCEKSLRPMSRFSCVLRTTSLLRGWQISGGRARREGDTLRTSRKLMASIRLWDGAGTGGSRYRW